MNNQQPKHVFISYVRENQDQADRLCQELEQHGVKVWLDRKSIKPGARWKDAIREAIGSGDFFIACFSDSYASKIKSYMNEELTLAIEELRQYGSDREWFIPVLLSECEVPARSIGAGETLLDINWVPLYEDWDSGIQRILSVIKPISPEIQNLISALRSKDRFLREEATKVLAEIGTEAKDAMPALIEVLKKDEDEFVRKSTVKTLKRIGPEAKDVVPALIEALKDEATLVRWAAANTLGYFGYRAKAAVPALIMALKDKDSCWHVAVALGEIGSEAKAAVPALIETLKDEDEKIRRSAAGAIGEIAWAFNEIEIEAKAANLALTKALKDKDENVRWAAKLALNKIKQPTVQKLIEEDKKKSKQFTEK